MEVKTSELLYLKNTVGLSLSDFWTAAPRTEHAISSLLWPLHNNSTYKMKFWNVQEMLWFFVPLQDYVA